MSIEAWPFLISRSKVLDYAVIVAPSYVAESNVVKLLTDITRGSVMGSGKALCRIVHSANGEDLTLVYRIDWGQLGDQILRDGYNRRIKWIMGFVLKGAVSEISVTKEDFERVYDDVFQDYENFRDQTELPPIKCSDPLELPLDGSSGTPLDVEVVEPYVVKPIVPDDPSERAVLSQREVPRITPESGAEVVEVYGDKVGPEVTEVIFDPSGTAFAVLGEKIVEVFRLPNFELVHDGGPLRSRGFDRYSTLSFSREGKYLALVNTKREYGSHGKVWNNTSEVWTWNCTTLKNDPDEPRLRVEHEILAVSFSPDGRYIVCGADNGEIFLCNLEEPTRPISKKGHGRRITATTFSPDGLTFATGGMDGAVRIWELFTGMGGSMRSLHTLRPLHRQAVRSIAFSPDGKLLASASDDTTIKIWDTSDLWNTASILEQSPLEHPKNWLGFSSDSVHSVAFANNQTLVSAGERFIKFWNVMKRQEIPVNGQILNQSGRLTSLDLSSDGRFLLSGYNNGRVRVLEVKH